MGLFHVPTLSLAQSPIPATDAFDAPACSDVDLGGVDINLGPFGIHTVPSPQRANPEWKAIILDANQQPQLQPPVIVEGRVEPQPTDGKSDSQSTSEVAEEDLPWTHYTHDFTFKVVPDPAYQFALSSWNRYPGVTGPASIDVPDQNGCPAGETFDPVNQYCIGCPNGGSFLSDQKLCQIVPPEICPDGSSGQLASIWTWKPSGTVPP